MSMMQRGLLSSFLTLAFAVSWALPARAGLDDYVKKADPAYAWNFVSSKTTDGTTVHWIKLTSQVWQGITWSHNLSIIEPKELAYPDAAVLFITGGKVGDGPRDGDLTVGFALAKACQARVIVLPQVPNQPLLGGKNEDTLIAETFVRYLETKDEEWPLLFPMVKSAVRAMDAAQEFGKEKDKPITRFVVTGASKRGWTTWLTGASDPRVKAIAPMVIPTLNLDAQNKHQLENFGGKFSEQIQDYTDRGLIGKESRPNAKELLAMVDPFTYRNRLRLPKLQINGTNDPYWTLDSLNLYWDELVGSKWVVYLPNAGHGLDQHRDYAMSAVGALFRHSIGEKPFPKFSWKHDDNEGSLRLVVDSAPAPKSVQVWEATSDSLDFRKSKWSATAVEPKEKMTIDKATPATGNIAFFADLEYEIDGFPYHLSTQIRQTNVQPSQ
ncbi:PhoPQ-activated pathogenicity-related protein [Singulisphaera sp. GP187]|uniref:PhoPQ-activated pathogenicity-related family protein n=1 Tax=Singulisphaera sp. GP187 TaxID=1882752 RepID=UPI00092994F3|nr:PhoPQ-activated protein PqaA family protein [Singulisphaera sp. GP187]SIO65592.1 PhoPQ-activated pathogenicity-related protein [Singulisphaera sp. GP187]